MTILFMGDVIVAPLPDTEMSNSELRERLIDGIGCLSNQAQACANVVAAVGDGSVPSDMMLRELSYAAATLSSVVSVASEVLHDLNKAEADKHE